MLYYVASQNHWSENQWLTNHALIELIWSQVRFESYTIATWFTSTVSSYILEFKRMVKDHAETKIFINDPVKASPRTIRMIPRLERQSRL